MVGAPLQLGALSSRLVRLWVNPALSRVATHLSLWCVMGYLMIDCCIANFLEIVTKRMDFENRPVRYLIDGSYV